MSCYTCLRKHIVQPSADKNQKRLSGANRKKNPKLWIISHLLKVFKSSCWMCWMPRLNVISVFLQASFPGNLHLVMVLRPTGFFQRTFTDIGFRFSQEDFLLKLPVWVCRGILPVCDWWLRLCLGPALQALTWRVTGASLPVVPTTTKSLL